MHLTTTPHDTAPTVALLTWGNLIEDFLEPNGLTIERFREGFTGSWIFAWARSLAVAGVRSEIVCVSRDARSTVHTTHEPTGTPLVILPTTRAYRAVERRMTYPYGRSARQVFGWTTPRPWPRRALAEVVREVAPYLATPPIRLARAARRGRWQAVLCQEYEYPRFDVCVLLGQAMRIPVFATFQGGREQHGRLERFVRRPAIALSAGLIVGPDREVERVRDRYGVPARKLTRTGNPLDTDVWRPRDRAAARRELDLPDDARIVVWHGRVAIEHKGLDLLLDAWRRLTTTNDSDLRLLLVGGGQDDPVVDRLVVEQRLPGVVRVDRHIHDPQVLSRYLSAADVYAFSSRHEGFAVAPLEAMACGLPIVATDVSGVRELLPEGEASGGIVVPINDAAALAAGIDRLLGDVALRHALGARALVRAESAFSIQVVGERLRDVLLGDQHGRWTPEG